MPQEPRSPRAPSPDSLEPPSSLLGPVPLDCAPPPPRSPPRSPVSASVGGLGNRPLPRHCGTAALRHCGRPLPRYLATSLPRRARRLEVRRHAGTLDLCLPARSERVLASAPLKGGQTRQTHSSEAVSGVSGLPHSDTPDTHSTHGFTPFLAHPHRKPLRLPLPLFDGSACLCAQTHSQTHSECASITVSG